MARNFFDVIKQNLFNIAMALIIAMLLIGAISFIWRYPVGHLYGSRRGRKSTERPTAVPHGATADTKAPHEQVADRLLTRP